MQFNLATAKGGRDASAEVENRVLALDTPKKRYDYLVGKGWKKGDVEKHGNFFICWWLAPVTSTREKQSHALRKQVFADMVAEGLVIRASAD